MPGKRRSGGKARVAPPAIKVRLYPLVAEAVEGGVRYGLRRLFKHESGPFGEDAVLERADTVTQAVLNELCDLIEFDPEDNG